MNHVSHAPVVVSIISRYITFLKPLFPPHTMTFKGVICVVTNYTLWTFFADSRHQRRHTPAKQTQGIHPMPFQCWPTVFDTGPTMKQHWVNAPCLLGAVYVIAELSRWPYHWDLPGAFHTESHRSTRHIYYTRLLPPHLLLRVNRDMAGPSASFHPLILRAYTYLLFNIHLQMWIVAVHVLTL